MISMMLSRPRQVRDNPENPSHPLTYPTEGMLLATGGVKTVSGVRVGPAIATTHAPVYRAVDLISGAVGKLPAFVYRRSGEGKERDSRHPAYYLLRRKPNPEITAVMFKKTMQAQALLHGNAFAWIERNGNGRPVNLWGPLNPFNMTIERTGERLIYTLTSEGMRPNVLDSSDVFHLKGLGDGIRGWGVVAKARESLGQSLATREYGARFFSQSGRGGIALSHPATLSPGAQANLRTNIMTHQGLENAHLPWILEEGMKMEVFSLKNDDAQFLQSREFDLIEIANWFGLPPHKLGHPTRTSFASLEQENQAYLDDAIDPWLVAWEEEAWDKLLSEPEKNNDTHIVEFLRQALLRANLNDRGAFYNTALLGGWMSRDEIRGRENLNPMPEGEGKKFFVPMNVSVVGEEPEEEPEEPPDEQVEGEEPQSEPAPRSAMIQSARRRALIDLLMRMGRRVMAQARKRSKDSRKYMAWIAEDLEKENRQVFLDAADPIVALVGSGTPGKLAEEWFPRVREAFLSAAEVKAAELEASVERITVQIERELPEIIAEDMLEED